AGLGLDPEAHINDNYLDLWQNHLDAFGQPRRDMVFGDTEDCPENKNSGRGPLPPEPDRERRI
ncbi:MAG: hypothetical protein LBE84_11980, partial [Planctomycetota bacterium]|nr:hypothetical protein [Planctomycetota bacterium]